MKQEADIVAAMIAASYKIVKEKYRSYVDENFTSYVHSLDFVAGRGRRTSHKKRGTKHIITYGVKAVVSKMQSKQIASRWLSGREIVDMGFFGGELTLKNSLIHTIIHEYAHYLQVLEGGRTKNSIHNCYFYSVVRRLYDDGLAVELSAYFDNNPVLKELCFKDVINSDIAPNDNTDIYSPQTVNKGDVVKFDATFKMLGVVEVEGAVKRANTKTVSVSIKNPLDKFMELDYRVPYHLIKSKNKK